MFVPQYDNNGDVSFYVGSLGDLCSLMKNGDLKSADPGLSQEKIDEAADALIPIISESLQEQDEFTINGLGVFSINPEDRPGPGEEIDPDKITVSIPAKDLENNGGLF